MIGLLTASNVQILLAITAIIVCTARFVPIIWAPAPELPVVAIKGLSPKQSWLQYGDEVLRYGIKTYGSRPFLVVTGTGPKIVLSNRYADEVSKHKAFSLAQSIKPDLFLQYPGFEGVRYSFEPEMKRDFQT
jgi:hypothetical protein